MPLTFVTGDPLRTRAQWLAFGSNALGRTETGALASELLRRYPAAFASYGKQCRRKRIQTGTLWTWRESQPRLGFMVVRASPVGATRLRYVENIALSLARDYRRDNIASIAIAPLGSRSEWPHIKPVLTRWLNNLELECVVYEDYVPGVAAEA